MCVLWGLGRTFCPALRAAVWRATSWAPREACLAACTSAATFRSLSRCVSEPIDAAPLTRVIGPSDLIACVRAFGIFSMNSGSVSMPSPSPSRAASISSIPGMSGFLLRTLFSACRSSRALSVPSASVSCARDMYLRR